MLVVESRFRHLSNVHFQKPSIDDIIAGYVPYYRVPFFPTYIMPESSVQELMSQDKFPLMIVHAAAAIDIDFLQMWVYRCHRNVHPLDGLCIVHQMKA